jgi:hypothetical protein
MEDLSFFAIVALVESQNDLSEDLPDDIFRHIVFVLFAPLYQLRHVATRTMLHYDVDLLMLLLYYPI